MPARWLLTFPQKTPLRSLEVDIEIGEGDICTVFHPQDKVSQIELTLQHIGGQNVDEYPDADQEVVRHRTKTNVFFAIYEPVPSNKAEGRQAAEVLGWPTGGCRRHGYIQNTRQLIHGSYSWICR